MKLQNTHVGQWLKLVRVQGTPLTVIPLLLGYATVENTILTYDVIPLIIVGVIGQWGVYVLNDVIDYKYDRMNNKDKPLVDGTIHYMSAHIVSYLLIIISLIIVGIYFPVVSGLLYVIALVLGIIYNKRSKTDEYRSVYMLCWGIIIILVGATYSNVPNVFSIILSISFGLYMMWVIWEDAIKDIGTGQKSIPETRLDSKLKTKDGKEYLDCSFRFGGAAWLIRFIMFILILFIPFTKIITNFIHLYDVVIFILSIPLGLVMFYTGHDIIYRGEFNRTEIKKSITKHTIWSAAFILTASLVFVDINSIFIMVLGSIIWGLIWTKVMYGELFYFP